jgi:hypothetical protein
MLIQSLAGELQFLSALPKTWSNGEVAGLGGQSIRSQPVPAQARPSP